jgi:hypothetical protein
MSYKDDEKFNAWMREIIESAWQAVEEYETFLRGTAKSSKKLSIKMKQLYSSLPVDPDRKKMGKDIDKKDPM